MGITGEVKHRVIYHCYAGYILSGAVMLIFGAILPYLIQEARLNYALAGGLLAFMAIGNFFASVFYPAARQFFSHRQIVTAVTGLTSPILVLYTLHPSIFMMYLMIFIIGTIKGIITLINNTMVNIVSGNSSRQQNFLHTTFAVGAFLSPFIMSALLFAGLSWRSIMYILAVAALAFPINYFTMDYSAVIARDAEDAGKRTAESSGTPDSAGSFLKNGDFLLISFIVFMYLGLENTVNGWFVTYLKDTGVMSAALATTMVSVTWVMIMLGRFVTGRLAGRFQNQQIIAVVLTVALAASVLLVNARTAGMAAVSIALLGLSMSPIYPTAMAASGKLVQGSTLGLSLITGISAVGGILIPELIGILADAMGIGSAMSAMVLDVVLAVVLAVLLLKRANRS